MKKLSAPGSNQTLSLNGISLVKSGSNVGGGGGVLQNLSQIQTPASSIQLSGANNIVVQLPNGGNSAISSGNNTTMVQRVVNQPSVINIQSNGQIHGTAINSNGQIVNATNGIQLASSQGGSGQLRQVVLAGGGTAASGNQVVLGGGNSPQIIQTASGLRQVVLAGGGANSNGQQQLIQTENGTLVRQVVVGGGATGQTEGGASLVRQVVVGGGATTSSGAGQTQLIQTSGGAMRQVVVGGASGQQLVQTAGGGVVRQVVVGGAGSNTGGQQNVRHVPIVLSGAGAGGANTATGGQQQIFKMSNGQTVALANGKLCVLSQGGGTGTPITIANNATVVNGNQGYSNVNQTSSVTQISQNGITKNGRNIEIVGGSDVKNNPSSMIATATTLNSGGTSSGVPPTPVSSHLPVQPSPIYSNHSTQGVQLHGTTNPPTTSQQNFTSAHPTIASVNQTLANIQQRPSVLASAVSSNNINLAANSSNNTGGQQILVGSAADLSSVKPKTEPIQQQTLSAGKYSNTTPYVDVIDMKPPKLEPGTNNTGPLSLVGSTSSVANNKPVGVVGPLVSTPSNNKGPTAGTSNGDSANNGTVAKVENTPVDAQAKDEEPEMDIFINNVVCSFSVRCHLNLKEIALSGSNVEYRRENGMVTMKLRHPYTTASIWSSGKVTCTGANTEEDAKIAARKFSRILQKLDEKYKNIRIKNWRIVNVLGTCNLPFGIKIVPFSQAFKEASYEPELHPGVTYKLKHPKATLKIFSTGSITVTAPSVANVQAAVEHIYPKVCEYQKPKDPEEMKADQLRGTKRKHYITNAIGDKCKAKKKRKMMAKMGYVSDEAEAVSDNDS